MPNKTLYVKEEDLPLWERAERLSGGRVSALVARVLRSYIEERELNDKADIKPIRVSVGGHHGIAREVEFVGSWINYPDPDYTSTTLEGYDPGTYWGVALTQKGSIAVHVAHVNDAFDASLEVYPSFEAAEADGVPSDILGAAASDMGAGYVQKLDI